MDEINNIVNTLSELYKEHSDEEIAIKQVAYMKDVAPYFGIQSTLRREICKPLINECKKLPVEDIFKLCDELMNLEQREYVYFVQDLLLSIFKKLTKDNIKHIITKYITIRPWWDNCDGFVMVIYRWININEKLLSQISNFCLRYKNMWIRRCGILLQLHCDNFNENVFIKTLESNIENKEFFIQKAIGWFLRELSKKDSDVVKKIYATYEHDFTSVAKREILKYLK